MPRVSEVYGSAHFLKAADLVGKGAVRVTIASVTTESFADDGSRPKLVMGFQGKQKKLVVNRSNAEALAAVFGDDCDGWLGREVTLSTRRVLFRGQMVDSIAVDIVHGTAPRTPAPPSQPASTSQRDAWPPAGGGEEGECPF